MQSIHAVKEGRIDKHGKKGKDSFRRLAKRAAVDASDDSLTPATNAESVFGPTATADKGHELNSPVTNSPSVSLDDGEEQEEPFSAADPAAAASDDANAPTAVQAAPAIKAAAVSATDKAAAESAVMGCDSGKSPLSNDSTAAAEADAVLAPEPDSKLGTPAKASLNRRESAMSTATAENAVRSTPRKSSLGSLTVPSAVCSAAAADSPTAGAKPNRPPPVRRAVPSSPGPQAANSPASRAVPSGATPAKATPSKRGREAVPGSPGDESAEGVKEQTPGKRRRNLLPPVPTAQACFRLLLPW